MPYTEHSSKKTNHVICYCSSKYFSLFDNTSNNMLGIKLALQTTSVLDDSGFIYIWKGIVFMTTEYSSMF